MKSRAVENWERYIRRHRAKRSGIPRSRAKPQGWSLAECARLAGVQPRTLRHYLEIGVLPRPPFRGTATRYGREHLFVVLAVRRLQSTENLALDVIRRRLDALGPAGLEAFATEHLTPGPAATALGIQFAQSPAPFEPKSSVDATGAAGWLHIELAVGLELHVRHDASPTVTALAERVREMCTRPTDALWTRGR
jgi:DNA-binding transcriptional MerR regulator